MRVRVPIRAAGGVAYFFARFDVAFSRQHADAALMVTRSRICGIMTGSTVYSINANSDFHNKCLHFTALRAHSFYWKVLIHCN